MTTPRLSLSPGSISSFGSRLSRPWLGALPLVAALVLSAPGCSTKRNTNQVPITGAIMITVDQASIDIDGIKPHQAQFIATIAGTDVTTGVNWSLAVDDQPVGSIGKNTGLFVPMTKPAFGGPITVIATTIPSGNSMPRQASATIVLNMKLPDVIDRNTSAGTVKAFGNPMNDQGHNPTILYPLAGALHARNLTQLNIQWKANTESTLFRITATDKAGHITQTMYMGKDQLLSGAAPYNGCKQMPDPDTGNNAMYCQYQPDDATWGAIANTAAKANPETGGSILLEVAAVVGTGSPLGRQSFELFFSPSAVRGGLYYFSPSISGLQRTPFGSKSATPFISNGNGTQCAGCHTISRDGKKVAATFYGADGAGGIVPGDNGSKWILSPTSGAVQPWNFATFSPDGELLLTNYDGHLTLRNGTTGQKKSEIPDALIGGPGYRAVMPEWSPDGTAVVFVQIPPGAYLGKDFDKSALSAGDWVIGNAGNIAKMTIDREGNFSTAAVIVPSTPGVEYHYFPSWSPDSSWIAFTTATVAGQEAERGWQNVFNTTNPTTLDVTLSYDQKTARLRLVDAGGTKAPIDLAIATHIPDMTTSWPKFAPFQQGSLMFITFSAKFQYGFTTNYLISGPPPAQAPHPQLWMSGIDTSKATTGADPSFPPFWLPFQDPVQSNHSGIWTQEVTCAQQSDCPGDYRCAEGKCIPGTGPG